MQEFGNLRTFHKNSHFATFILNSALKCAQSFLLVILGLLISVTPQSQHFSSLSNVVQQYSNINHGTNQGLVQIHPMDSLGMYGSPSAYKTMTFSPSSLISVSTDHQNYTFNQHQSPNPIYYGDQKVQSGLFTKPMHPKTTSNETMTMAMQPAVVVQTKMMPMPMTSMMETSSSVSKMVPPSTNRQILPTFGYTSLDNYQNDPVFMELEQRGKELIEAGQLSELDFQRGRRGAIQLAAMVQCGSGCDPLIFNGYGCYCGFLGQGPTMDSIDRCCKEHDDCYTRSTCTGLEFHLPYFVPFQWMCTRNRNVKCFSPTVGMSNSMVSCAYQLCKCDANFSNCLGRHTCPKLKLQCPSQFRSGVQTIFSRLTSLIQRMRGSMSMKMKKKKRPRPKPPKHYYAKYMKNRPKRHFHHLMLVFAPQSRKRS